MRFPSKPLLSLSLAVQLLSPALWSLTPVQAQPTQNSTPVISQSASSTQIPEPLAQNIRESIVTVYGKDQAEEIYSQVLQHVQKARQQRPKEFLKQDLARPSDWYKNEVVYMLYADRFGLKPGQTATNFKDVSGTLDYLQELGVTTLYILPFMDSPMGDAGFDVRDFQSVRSDLGGLNGFQAFASEARKRGFKIKSDLILNHVSDQHAWFQSALKGDQEKLNYFLVTDQEPKYRKYKDPEKGILVDYQESDGKVSSRSLVFPDISSTQYREISIQGKPHYFYHTFYPFQMDLNWQNPKVLYEVLDIVSFWANQGVDIFRLDAVSYLVKPKGTNGENQPETLALIKLLSAYLEATAPSSVLQAEAGQKLQALLPYFGDEQLTMLNINGHPKPIERTNRVQIAYNFPYMSAIWACMITQNHQQFWDVAGTTPALPDPASWSTFLRVHDELTLQMVEPKAREIIAQNLEPKGAEFRKGWGVSGRMANFLDQNPARIEQAFSIMFSLPGIPLIYYGDEIGEVNDFEFARQYAKQREATQTKNNPNLDIISFYDSRDVNRGPLLQSHMEQALRQPKAPSGKLFAAVKNLIAIRKSSEALKKGSLMALHTDQPSVLAYLRESNNQTVLVLHNLSAQATEATLNVPEQWSPTKSSSPKLFNLADNHQVSYQQHDKTWHVQMAPYQSMWLLAEKSL